MVTWSCRGCGPSSAGQTPLLVARYSQDGSVHQPGGHHLRLLVPTFQLEISPATTGDAGRYVCSVNNAPSANSVTVIVEGQCTCRSGG